MQWPGQRKSSARESEDYDQVVQKVRRSMAASMSSTAPRKQSLAARVSMVSSGLSHAIGVVRSQRTKLVQGQDGDGALGTMNWRVFALGVVNALATAYILGACPEHFWVYYTISSLILLPIRFSSWKKAKLHLYLLDFCWLTNYLLCALALLCLCTQILHNYIPGITNMTPTPETERKAYLLLFAIVEGPLAMAVGVTGNSLVFHSFELTASLFIHASPMLVGWTFRWYGQAVEAHYPGLLGGATSLLVPVDLWSDLALPAICYYFAWWVPYTTWLLTDGVTRPERGYDTVFANFRPLVEGQLGIKDVRLAALTYMCLHAVATNLAWIISVGCYASFYFHTFIVCSMLFLAIKSGASMYEYLILDSYDEALRKELEGRGKSSSIALL